MSPVSLFSEGKEWTCVIFLEVVYQTYRNLKTQQTLETDQHTKYGQAGIFFM